MNINARQSMIFTLKLGGFALLAFQIQAFAQGSLTPPSAPEPTMKSLSQIEPRTTISSAPFTIVQPGSFYLTTNVTVSAGDAITITASNVTLDLNGFTISSSAASAVGAGILLNGGLKNITIANGFILSGVTNNGAGIYSGSGFASGIMISGSEAENVLISRVGVSGCLNNGIYLNIYVSTLVESCTTRTTGGIGITAATVKSCSAIGCGFIGIRASTASDCFSFSYGNGTGLDAFNASNCRAYVYGSNPGLNATTAHNCYGQNNGSGIGLSASAAENCYGVGNVGTGLYATTALNCYGTSAGNSSFGLRATSAQNCYGYNSGGGTGLYGEELAIGCYGYANSGTGLSANIANSCRGTTSSGTPQAVNHPYNMP
jgi:hypothetical protein